MSKFKPIYYPFTSHFKLSSKYCPTSDEEIKKMNKVFLCISSWLLNVCHNLYETGFSSCCWCGQLTSH